MQIGWIDYSKEERNKIVNVLRLLKTQGTVDEIGIGSVRDAFSDKLFPGISVLQTRAKYFVLIPYLFDLACQRCAEGKLHSPKEVRTYIEKQEDKLVEILLKSAKNNEERMGIIGSRNYLSGKSVKAKPSSIYWNGMRQSTILRYPEFSIDSACRVIYQKGRLLSKTERKYEMTDTGSDDADAVNDGHILFAPIFAKYDFMNEAEIKLTLDEAEYIFYRFTESEETKDAAMAYMLKNPDLIWKYDTFQQFRPSDFPEYLSKTVLYAKQFADFIYGAHLLYNIIFAEGCNVNDDEVKEIKSEFKKYCRQYHRPNFEEIINISRCKGDIVRFFTSFDTCISKGNIEKAKKLIIDREDAVKHGRTKLYRPQEYQFEGAIHYYKLNYRYDTACRIMKDIVEGLDK